MMHRFDILPVDPQLIPAKVRARDAGSALHKIVRLGCTQADVLEDGQYSFSVRINPAGFWSVYRRDEEAKPVGHTTINIG